MFKKSALFFIILLNSLLAPSCKKKMSHEEVEQNLKGAMDYYLNVQSGRDTSLVKFKAVDVLYYEEKTQYICEFHVHMKQKTPTVSIDTTGLMKAWISKDFRNVSRRN
jgi:hypothetical protein